MKKQSTGALGSVAGVSGLGSSIPYAATKSAIHTMTRSLAISLAPNVRVNLYLLVSGRHALVGWE